MPTKANIAGIVLIVAGAEFLIRTIVSMTSGEQAQLGALGKGIGLSVGGAVLCALHHTAQDFKKIVVSKTSMKP